jgi:hypothetical protein
VNRVFYSVFVWKCTENEQAPFRSEVVAESTVMQQHAPLAYVRVYAFLRHLHVAFMQYTVDNRKKSIKKKQAIGLKMHLQDATRYLDFISVLTAL